MSIEGIILGQAGRATFIWNDRVLQEIFAGPNGPVARDLAQRCIKVESQAKQNASGRPGPNVVTGRLRSSIGWRIVVTAGTLIGQVGTNVEYAYWLEVAGVGAARVRYPFLRPALIAAGGDTVATR